MNKIGILAGVALGAAFAVSSASAQQPQRLSGTIEKVTGNALLVKAKDGDLTVTLADKSLIVGVTKASFADIKAGSYIGSGAVLQADGTQKAVEVHIFAESQRGTGDGTTTVVGTNGTDRGEAGNPVTGRRPDPDSQGKGRREDPGHHGTPIVQYQVSDASALAGRHQHHAATRSRMAPSRPTVSMSGSTAWFELTGGAAFRLCSALTLEGGFSFSAGPTSQ